MLHRRVMAAQSLVVSVWAKVVLCWSVTVGMSGKTEVAFLLMPHARNSCFASAAISEQEAIKCQLPRISSSIMALFSRGSGPNSAT